MHGRLATAGAGLVTALVLLVVPAVPAGAAVSGPAPRQNVTAVLYRAHPFLPTYQIVMQARVSSRLARAIDGAAMAYGAYQDAQAAAAAQAAAEAKAATPSPSPAGSSPAPSPSPQPAPQPSGSGQLTPAQVGAYWLAAGGPAWAEQASESVAMCESGDNANATNPSSGAAGLWQILGSVVGGDLYDPAVNAANAVSKFETSGNTWAQWTCQP